MRFSGRSFLGTFLHLSAAAALGLSTGCTELSWHRDGTDTAAVERDLQECRQQARAHSAHLAWPFPDSTARPIATDRAGRPVITPYPYPTWLENDQRVLRSGLIGDCMRDKGYALAPAGAGAQQ